MNLTKRHIQPKISGPAKTFFGQKKWSGRTADDGLVLTVEALPEGGDEGGTCSFVPWNKLACSPAPQKSKICFLMFPVPQ